MRVVATSRGQQRGHPGDGLDPARRAGQDEKQRPRERRAAGRREGRQHDGRGQHDGPVFGEGIGRRRRVFQALEVVTNCDRLGIKRIYT
mgnify:CR=1 FL=1